MNMQGCNAMGRPMPAVVKEAPASISVRWLGRDLSGLMMRGGVWLRDRKLQA